MRKILLFKKLSVFIFLFLFLLLGCSKDVVREKHLIMNEENDWKINGYVYRDGNSSWYLDADVFYTGDEELNNYIITIVVPKPLSINASLKGGNPDLIKESSLGARLHSSQIHGSKGYMIDELLSVLSEGYVEISFMTSGQSFINKIMLYEK